MFEAHQNRRKKVRDQALAVKPNALRVLLTSLAVLALYAGTLNGAADFGIGSEVPSFTLMTGQGRKISLRNFAKRQGKKNTLLVFFRTGTCHVCVNYLVQIQQKLPAFQAFDTSILAVSLDDAIIQKGVHDLLGGAIPILLDPDAKLVNHFQVFNPADKLSRPAVFFWGPNLKIRDFHVGKTLTDRPTIDTLLSWAASPQSGRSRRSISSSDSNTKPPPDLNQP